MLAQIAEAVDVDLTGFTTALTGSITPAQILTVIGSVVGIGMAFVLMWFGVRTAVQIFISLFLFFL